MNLPTSTALAHWLSSQLPVLPVAGTMQTWLLLGWAVVLVWVFTGLVSRRWPDQPRLQFAVALVVVLWICAPGPYSPASWLGLAFQAPSGLGVFLCAGFLYQRWAPSDNGLRLARNGGRVLPVLALTGALTGWALLLDTFALLPVQLYAWGFSPAALALACLCVLLPWAVLGSTTQSACPSAWAAPIALAVFAFWRLPTGNVWDALLDPWLWLASHGYLGRWVWSRRGSRGFPLIA